MHYKLMGRSGLAVSELWFGTATFGQEGWGAPEDTCARLLDAYLDAGGNVIDTASSYAGGASEEILGRLLGARRERLVVSTKYSMSRRPDDPNGGGSHRRHLVEALETSLRRLDTDRIDVLWVHFYDELTPVEEIMRALDDQIRLGKVLYVGVSNWPAWEISRATTLAELRGWTPFVGLQTQYHLLERTPERDLFPMADRLGLSVGAWSPLGRGMLTGKYLEPGAPGRLTTMGRAGMDERTEAIVRETVAVAEEVGAPPSQVALAWLLGRGAFPIVAGTKEEQLADNLGAVDVRLAPGHVDRLEAVSAIEHGFPHDWLRGDVMRRANWGPARLDVEAY